MSITTDILNGQHDTDLATIQAAIQVRRKALAYVTVDTLSSGDQVCSFQRPSGSISLVVKVDRESVVVSCPSA